MITKENLEWATFLYNVMGEDTFYFEDSENVREGLNDGGPGKAVADFLNHWRMRISSNKVSSEINRWYCNEKDLINSFSESLLDINLDDNANIKKISDLYEKLCNIDKIKDKGASKILHLIKPELFIMWDNLIREHYLKNNGVKGLRGTFAYISFMKKMQNIAVSLYDKDRNITQSLSSNLVMLLSGKLNRLTKDEEKQRLQKAIDWLKKDEKQITKYLDEYNWIVITRKIAIPPAWHP